MRIGRREFMGLVAASPALARLKVRHAEVETVFDSPGPKPNGLQGTAEGLWILDQGDNRAYLVDYASGKTLRELDTDTEAGSGITFDGNALWTASTYSREILKIDAHTGKTLRRFNSPGSGVVAWTTPRRSPLAPPAPPTLSRGVRGTQPARTAWSGGTGSCGCRCPRHSRFTESILDHSRSRNNSLRLATGRTAWAGKAAGSGARSPTTTRSTALIPRQARLTPRSSLPTPTRCLME